MKKYVIIRYLPNTTTQVITFIVEGQLKLALEIEAHKQGRSLNNLLTQIVKEYLKAKKIGPAFLCKPFNFISIYL